jgi:enoyl-CoA hydratase/carnithine racemase/NAD(P)-dependent dehydrogenase (short-subunit alcohol dehydrogenase family)
MTALVRLDVTDRVARLTIDRPAKRNAVTGEMWATLRRHIATIEETDVVAVVLGGAGGSFSAGADLGELHVAALRELAEDTVRAVRDLPPPTLAAIDGACFGAGCSLALACDVRICSPTSRFGIPALRNGLTYEPAHVRRLVQVLGPGPAGLLLYGGGTWTAQEAAAHGLVDRCCDDPSAAVEQILGVLRGAPPAAVTVDRRGHQVRRVGVDLQLRGARAIVTGGSRGIGLAVAHGLVAEGARVALVARGQGRLRAAAAGLGTGVLAIPADTTDDVAVRAMVDRVVAAWGGVDVLVNAAAEPSAGAPPALADLTDGGVQADFDTKVLGYLRCVRAVAPHMTRQGAGRIVNVSGLNARRTGSVSGTIRNVAVAALTANLADELGPHGVGVTVVHPGLIATDRTPDVVAAPRAPPTTSLQRLVTVEEVAAVVVFLCSRRAAAVTGDAVGVAGGNRGTVHY